MSEFLGCSYEYLATGNGEPLQPTSTPNQAKNVATNQQERTQEKQSEIKITALLMMTAEVIESDTVYRPALISNIKAFHQAAIGCEEDLDDNEISVREMLLKTAAVLESTTIYRAALLSNVLAFHRAVEGEKEMGMVKDELLVIRAQNVDILARLENVERSQQVTPVLPAKKREAI